MRGIFSALSLIVVLAIVGMVALKQIGRIAPQATPVAGGSLSGPAASSTGVSDPAKHLPAQVGGEVNKILQQGAQRNQSAD